MAWNNEVSTALTNDDQKIAALEKRITQLENAIAGKIDNDTYDELAGIVSTHTNQIIGISENQTSISEEEVSPLVIKTLKTVVKNGLPAVCAKWDTENVL